MKTGNILLVVVIVLIAWGMIGQIACQLEGDDTNHNTFVTSPDSTGADSTGCPEPPPCPPCPECPEPPECPECPDCPECPECPDTTFNDDLERCIRFHMDKKGNSFREAVEDCILIHGRLN